MPLTSLVEKSIRSGQLESAALQRIHHHLDRAPHLSADEFEALRKLGAALRDGTVDRCEVEHDLAV